MARANGDPGLSPARVDGDPGLPSTRMLLLFLALATALPWLAMLYLACQDPVATRQGAPRDSVIVPAGIVPAGIVRAGAARYPDPPRPAALA